MVFFNCDKCSEALKKNQVEKHGFKCRNATYSCLDCGECFSLVTYKLHMKCLTEGEKYGGKNYIEKEHKGEVKQNRWIEQVERAIENVKEPLLKQLLQQIRGFSNIPRKEAKFINLLQNSTKIKDRDLCVKAWNCIAEQAKLMQEDEKNKSNNFEEKDSTVQKDEKVCLNCEKEQPSQRNTKNETMNSSTDENGDAEQIITNGVKKFKWKRAIKRTLKDAENGEMKIKRLRSAVIRKYLASGDQSSESNEDPEIIFKSKLQSLNLHIDGKIVRLRMNSS